MFECYMLSSLDFEGKICYRAPTYERLSVVCEKLVNFMEILNRSRLIFESFIERRSIPRFVVERKKL